MKSYVAYALAGAFALGLGDLGNGRHRRVRQHVHPGPCLG